MVVGKDLLAASENAKSSRRSDKWFQESNADLFQSKDREKRGRQLMRPLPWKESRRGTSVSAEIREPTERARSAKPQSRVQCTTAVPTAFLFLVHRTGRRLSGSKSETGATMGSGFWVSVASAESSGKIQRTYHNMILD